MVKTNNTQNSCAFTGKNDSRRILFLFVLFLLFPTDADWRLGAEKPRSIDITEKIMKIKSQYPNDFNRLGFGAYDWGDSSYKIFNWNFELIRTFPVKTGEGPGEILPYVYNAFTYRDIIGLHGHCSDKLEIYSLPSGNHLRTIPLNFRPRHILMNKDKIYAFNSIPETGPSPFAVILDAATLEKTGSIFLKSPTPKHKDLGDDVAMYFIHFTLDPSGNIYMLHGLDNSLLIIGADGVIRKRISLPFNSRVGYREVKNGEGSDVVLDTLEFYSDIKMVAGFVYITFLKTLKVNTDGKPNEYQTRLTELSPEFKMSERNFPGSLIILGEDSDRLYLFNRYDYDITAVSVPFGSPSGGSKAPR